MKEIWKKYKNKEVMNWYYISNFGREDIFLQKQERNYQNLVKDIMPH